MHSVCLIRSSVTNSIYVRNTTDLDQRIAQHNRGLVDATKDAKPYNLVYYEAYADKKDAVNRELKLKHHGSSIGHLKRRLKFSMN